MTSEPAIRAKGLASRKRRRRQLTKAAVFAVAALPLTRLAWQALHAELGANPIAEGLNRLGYWALVLLLSSLACTPAQRLTGWAWPVAVRRILGLFAFVYATLHVSVYLGVDQFFDFREILRDVLKRPFITVGSLAFVVLVPLAVTSTHRMVKRLGFARWKRLHRWVYLAALAGVVHFLWRVKADHREPLVFVGALILLMALRWPRLWPARPGDVSRSRALPSSSSVTASSSRPPLA